MTNKLLALLLPAALTIAQIAEAKKPRQIPDWYPDKDSLYRAVESIPPFGIYKDNYIVTGTSFSEAASRKTIRTPNSRSACGTG